MFVPRPYADVPPVFISYGFCNKLSQTWWLKSNRNCWVVETSRSESLDWIPDPTSQSPSNLFFHSSGGQQSKIKGLLGSHSLTSLLDYLFQFLIAPEIFCFLAASVLSSQSFLSCISSLLLLRKLALEFRTHIANP